MTQDLDLNKLMDVSDLPNIEGDEILVYPPLVLEKVESNPNNRQPDLEDDYSLVRQNFHWQQQMIMDASKIFLETAKNADSPKHMEVFATLMSQFTNNSKELLKLHKEMKEITNETTVTKGGSFNIETANIVMGSPTEMLDQYGDSYEAKENARKNN